MNERPFDGYDQLIRVPLESHDPVSFRRVSRALLDFAPPHLEPFSFLLKRLVGKPCQEYRARTHWQKILEHKTEMESRLERVISIQTAAVDYFTIVDDKDHFYARQQLTASAEKNASDGGPDAWLHRIYAPDYHTDRLKTELMRCKRYNHALSTILMDIDEFHQVNQKFSYETGDEILKTIVKIVRSTIRSVDAIARYHGDRFLVILPDTNKREAIELAERLRKKVPDRTSRVKSLSSGVTATLAVGQCNANDTAGDYMKRLESTLERGKSSGRNQVYALSD